MWKVIIEYLIKKHLPNYHLTKIRKVQKVTVVENESERRLAS
jgi:hypothetical protein